MKVIEENFVGGSSSSSRPIHIYLSFIGDDETCNFTDRLWATLESNDLNTFWDDKKLDSADSIILPSRFLKAIRQSNVSIVVFSKNYASSILCLEELSEIAARIHEPQYTVFPIFYGVHPWEVQNLSNSFEKAFVEHEQRFTANLHNVQRWRLAIRQVTDLSGRALPSEPEPQVIDDIIKEVKRKMRELVNVDVDLVGMHIRVREVEKLMDLGSNGEIRFVGICGMGGVGKSTLARVLHDKISHHFDASYLILNATDFHAAAWLIRHKKTLVVLDLVDFKDILPSLIGVVRKNKLGEGSRIIITNRDEGVIKQFEKHDIYRVKPLTEDEALQLFCRKVFRCDFPIRGYEKQIDSVLQYANGHPLAIVMLGSFLSNRRASDWSDALVQFKILYNPLLMKVLKESFDDLDKNHKEAFLDIACFFMGKEIKFVEGILRCRDFLKDNGIQFLVEKSLITIKDKKIQMHSLLQEMGREIVRDEFPFKPELWRRLWDFDDIYNIMNNHTSQAILNVEAIVLEQEDSRGRILRVEALSRMSNLKLLIFRNVKFSGALEHLSSRLQYISWHHYPFTSFPSSFQPHKLKELILPESHITSIWEGEKESSPSVSILLHMLLQAHRKISQQESPPSSIEKGETMKSPPSLLKLWGMVCRAEKQMSPEQIRALLLRDQVGTEESPSLLTLRDLLHEVDDEISTQQSLRSMKGEVFKEIFPNVGSGINTMDLEASNFSCSEELKHIKTVPAEIFLSVIGGNSFALLKELLDCYMASVVNDSFVSSSLPRLRLVLHKVEEMWPQLYLSISGVTLRDILCWRQQKEFPCLTNLNLSGSKDLTKISNFEKFPSLERLDLEGCINLSQLHTSIAHVSPNLKFLNLRNCTNLVSIPNKLFSLPSLEILNLACCSKLATCLNFHPTEEIELPPTEEIIEKSSTLLRRLNFPLLRRLLKNLPPY